MNAALFGQVWSATPTPFHPDLSPDLASVEKMVEAQTHLDGLMLGGTCGEGPWMPFDDLLEITQRAIATAAGRLAIAVQVTDNSPRRILGHIEKVAALGADYAVVAAPYFQMNTSPARMLKFYQEILRHSALPIGFYDRGKHSPYRVESEDLSCLLNEPNLHLVKDSSADPQRRAIYQKVAATRPELAIFNGDEFDTIPYLQAGYHGLLLGGGIFNGRFAKLIISALRQGDTSRAQKIQIAMNALMLDVYGGPKITCWLAGLKYLLQRQGVFTHLTNYPGYALSDECRTAIDNIDLEALLDKISPHAALP